MKLRGRENRSLPAHDSVGDEGKPDEVERHQNSQDLPDCDCGKHVTTLPLTPSSQPTILSRLQLRLRRLLRHPLCYSSSDVSNSLCAELFLCLLCRCSFWRCSLNPCPPRLLTCPHFSFGSGTELLPLFGAFSGWGRSSSRNLAQHLFEFFLQPLDSFLEIGCFS